MPLSLEQLHAELAAATTEHDFHQLKARYLGKKGIVTQAIKALADLSVDQRKEQGPALNALKEQVRQIFASEQQRRQEQEALQASQQTVPDTSLPGTPSKALKGRQHPLSQIKEELIGLFVQRGFDWTDGPEVETHFYNFEALNIPPDHPARQMHDTFYVDSEHLLRTHTSPVQIRYLENRKPPVKMIAPGRVYRCDSDPTHTPMFHQIEGLVLDNHASLLDLRELLADVLEEFFQKAVPMRFRPSYFPFTDPSVEVDIGWGEDSKWLEVLGCGIVHPEVLRQMGCADTGVQGYAFGLGVERLAMLKLGVPDLRMFFDNHLHFLQQF